MDDTIGRALGRGHRIDITTTGRRTGRPHRIELVFHNIEGRIHISGRPGPRDWYANILADPRMTFHLKGPVSADLRARAVPVTDDVERRRVMDFIARAWRMPPEPLVQGSPLIEVVFDDPRVRAAAPVQGAV